MKRLVLFLATAIGLHGALTYAGPLDELQILRNPQPTDSHFQDVAFGAGRFVAVDANLRTWISTDGSSWRATPGAGTSFRSIQFLDGQFVATGFSRVGSSIDGESWTVTTGVTSRPLNGLAKGDTLHVVVADGGMLATSPDLETWTQRDSSVRRNLNAVAHGVRFVAVGDLGTIITSETGDSWETRDSGTTQSLQGVAWTGARFVAVGSSFTILSSPDGIDWTTVTSNETFRWLREVRVLDGTLVAIGDQGIIAISGSGDEWTVLDPATDRTLNGVALGDSSVVVVGNSGTLLRSTDGVQWSLSPESRSVTFQDLTRVEFGNGTYVAVGDLGAVVHSESGESWSLASTGEDFLIQWGLAFGNGVFVVAGRNQQDGRAMISTSTDGSTWERTLELTNATFSDVVFGDGKFVAVGSALTSDKISISSDGREWRGTGPLTAEWLRAVEYGAGLFVAVGQSGQIFTSENAEIWVPATSPTNDWLDGIAYGNGRWVAYGGQNNRVALHSDNGIVWTSVNVDFALASLGQLVFDGERFLTLHGRTINASIDGETWERQTFRPALNAIALGDSGWIGVANAGTIVQSGTPPLVETPRMLVPGRSYGRLLAPGQSTRLEVLVTDTSEQPLSDLEVLFLAPDEGASGHFGETPGTITARATTGPNGIAAVDFTANETEGVYLVDAALEQVVLERVARLTFGITNTSRAPAPPLSAIATRAHVEDSLLLGEPLDADLQVHGPVLLEPGSTISPAVVGVAPFSGSPIELERTSWLLWIDDVPGALFAHPTRFVIIDATSNDVEDVTSTRQGWWPVVRAPGEERGQQLQSRFALNTRVGLDDPPVGAGAGEDERSCAVVVYGPSEQTLENNANSMEKLFRDHFGVDRVFTSTDADGSSRVSSPADLRRLLEDAREDGCRKLFISISGHGYPGGFSLGREPDDPSPNGSIYENISYADFADLLRPFADLDTEICLVASACFSGGVIPHLQGLGVQGKVATSAARNKTSYLSDIITSNFFGTRSFWIAALDECWKDRNADLPSNGGNGDGVVDLCEANNWVLASTWTLLPYNAVSGSPRSSTITRESRVQPTYDLLIARSGDSESLLIPRPAGATGPLRYEVKIRNAGVAVFQESEDPDDTAAFVTRLLPTGEKFLRLTVRGLRDGITSYDVVTTTDSLLGVQLEFLGSGSIQVGSGYVAQPSPLTAEVGTSGLVLLRRVGVIGQLPRTSRVRLRSLSPEIAVPTQSEVLFAPGVDFVPILIDAISPGRARFLAEDPLYELATEFEVIVVGANTLQDNDRCSGAIRLDIGEEQFGTTLGATPRAEPSCSAAESAGLWYLVSGTGETLEVSVRSESIPPMRVSVFEGGCSEARCVGLDETPDDSFPPSVRTVFETMPGTLYPVLVDNPFADVAGDFRIELETANTFPGLDVTGSFDDGTVAIDVRWDEIISPGVFRVEPVDNCGGVPLPPAINIVPDACKDISFSGGFDGQFQITYRLNIPAVFGEVIPPPERVYVLHSSRGQPFEPLPRPFTPRVTGNILEIAGISSGFSIFTIGVESTAEPGFRRGDGNLDGSVDISDAVRILNRLFLGAAPFPCEDSADANDDGRIDVSDAIKIFGFLFLGDAALPPPGATACGVDPSADDSLPCDTPPVDCG